MTIKKVLVLIFALLFLVSGCGSDTTTNSSSILPTKNIQYGFNKDQLDFLKTLGIHNVYSFEDHGKYKSFTFDGEVFEVYVNESNTITEIKFGVTLANNILWNDVKGKIGMIKSEYKAVKKQFLSDFLNESEKRYDQAEQITYIDKNIIPIPNYKGIFPYMVLKGKDLTGKKWLRVNLYCSNQNLVFFKKVIFSNSNETWTYEIPDIFSIKRDVGYGTFNESYDTSFTDVRRGLEIIAFGENPRIDFIGQHNRAGRNLEPFEVNHIKKYCVLQHVLDDK